MEERRVFSMRDKVGVVRTDPSCLIHSRKIKEAVSLQPF